MQPAPEGTDVLVETFFPLAPVALALVDEDMRYIAVNEVHAAIVGVSIEDTVGRTVAEVVPGAAEKMSHVHRRVLRGETIRDVEMHTETPAERGVERSFVVSYYPVEVDGRRAVGAIAMDITKRVHAERALRESEERFRGVFEHGLVGMDIVDGEGRFLRANRAICRILGRSEEELRELDFYEITHPDDRERSRQAFDRLILGEVDHYDIEKRYLRPDGEIVHGRVMVAGVRDTDGRLRLIVSQLLDMTEMKVAEERTLRHSRQLAEAERLAHVGSWQWNPGDGTVVASDELYRILGIENGSVELDVDLFQELVHPDDRADVQRLLFQAVAEPREYTLDCRIVQPSGPVRAITVTGEPVLGRGGELEAYIGSAMDVTDRTRREAEAEAVTTLRQHALEGASVTRLAQEATDMCARIVGAQFGGVFARDREGDLRLIAGVGFPPGVVGSAVLPGGGASHPGAAVRENAPIVVDDWQAEQRFSRLIQLPGPELRSAVAVPIPAEGAPFGALGMQSHEPGRFLREDVEFLQAIAGALGTAIERRRADDRIAGLAEARRRLVAQTLDAEDQTRRDISELLHDHALQDLLAARQDLAEASQDEARAAEHAGRAREGLERAIRQLREAVAELHPVVLEHGGLASALAVVAEHQSRRGGFEADVAVDADAVGFHDQLLLSLSRELLHNAAKHADASTVRVHATRSGDEIVLEVRDDGRGFDQLRLESAVLEGHIGLASHAERVEGVGGRLEVDSRRGSGTTVRAVLPIVGA